MINQLVKKIKEMEAPIVGWTGSNVELYSAAYSEKSGR